MPEPGRESEPSELPHARAASAPERLGGPVRVPSRRRRRCCAPRVATTAGRERAGGLLPEARHGERHDHGRERTWRERWRGGLRSTGVADASSKGASSAGAERRQEQGRQPRRRHPGERHPEQRRPRGSAARGRRRQRRARPRGHRSAPESRRRRTRPRRRALGSRPAPWSALSATTGCEAAEDSGADSAAASSRARSRSRISRRVRPASGDPPTPDEAGVRGS